MLEFFFASGVISKHALPTVASSIVSLFLISQLSLDMNNIFLWVLLKTTHFSNREEHRLL